VTHLPDRRNTAKSAPDKRSLLLLLLATLLALPLSYWIASTAPDLENLALGETTLPVYGDYGGDKVFCASLEELPLCLEPASKRRLGKTVMWLGNSQLHAINQAKPGDKTAPVLVAETLRPKAIEVQALSFPSGSLSEFYLSYLHVREKLKVDVLVVPLFLDDTREGSIRAMLAPIAGEAGAHNHLSQTVAGQSILAAVASEQVKVEAPLNEPEHLRDSSENALTGFLQRCCGFQTMREEARGQIAIQAFLFRNWIFGITAQTVRPIIARAYEFNMGSLNQLLADAKSQNTKVILYIAPIRQDVSPPYDPAEYKQFKMETGVMAEKHGAVWVDLDNIVDAQFWGTKAATVTGGGAELDFMHYQEPGHVALAEKILPLVEGALK
jgi:hypothetical protein